MGITGLGVRDPFPRSTQSLRIKPFDELGINEEGKL